MFIGGDTSGQDYTSQFGYQYHDTETCLANDVQEVDIYRVNHHGSDHSSNSAFIAALKPQAAIISVGDANPYGHPRQVVMDRLSGPSPSTPGGVQVYMTQRGDTSVNVYNAKVVGNCDVTVSSDGSTFTVSGNGASDTYTSHATRRHRSLLRGHN
jgi:beta-lactamase superfamily II metal-dependent hydrolase